MNLSLGFIFIAGFVSFLSPCVLSMVPIYLGILGANTNFDHEGLPSRFRILISGSFFILGFTLVFMTLGLSTTLLGNLLYGLKPWIARIGGVIIIIYGISLTGWLKLPISDSDIKIQKNYFSNHPLVNSFWMGIIFSAGWSPCIGPILGTILTFILSTEVSIFTGVLYLFIYSMGIAVPFLLTAICLEPAVKRILKKPLLLKRIQQVSGIVLVIIGVLLSLGWISRLAQITPKWLL
jgi:cytochrome c-type biogenesis protein